MAVPAPANQTTTSVAIVDAAGGFAGSSSVAALSTVADTASSISLLASNSARKGALFFNESTQTLYLKFGVTASFTSYTVQIAPGGLFEMPVPIYTGAVDGIWAADAAGSVRITELT